MSAEYDFKPMSMRELHNAEKQAWSAYLDTVRELASLRAQIDNQAHPPQGLVADERAAAARMEMARSKHLALEEQIAERDGG